MTINQNPKLILAYSTIDYGNMSFIRGDYEGTLQNRRQFLAQNKLSLERTVWMKTPHEGDAHIATSHDLGKGSKDLESTIPVDALITNQKGIILSLVTADCIPLSLFDPKTQTIALLHVSRHNINSIIQNTIQTLTQNFEVNPKNLLSEIGPSIGPCCYTWILHIDPPLEATYEEFVLEKPDGSATLDLWGLTEKRLHQQGLKKDNIHNPQICSFHSGNYFSHRKSEEHQLKNDYRFATFLALKS